MEGDSPQRFGKYTLMRRLAVGGMAEIFLAEHHGEAGFVRPVVIKRVLPNLTENPEFVTMFLDEARLLARLTHPNVVHVYDFGRIEDQYFLSLEYVYGGNLREVLVRQRGTPVPLGQSLYVVGQALAGIDHAHRAKGPDGASLRLVHRDISPSNILLSMDGAVKVADFGIARSTVQQVHTAAFVIKGKLAYMSPEQVTGRPLDGRSDLFSVGVVLWEMLTGRRLFSRESAADIQRAICAEPLPDVTALRPDLPQPVLTLLEHALQRDRDDRFTSAAAMQMAVDECMAQCRLVGGAQHLGIFMKQVFPELTEEGALLDDDAPTVMRDHVVFPGTQVLVEQSESGTAPGVLRPREPTPPRTATPAAAAPPRAMTPLGTAPPRTMTPLGTAPPRTMTPLGTAPPATPALPPVIQAIVDRSGPTASPVPSSAEAQRSGKVSAPLTLPPSEALPVSAPLTLPPSEALPVSAPLTLPPSEGLPVSAPLMLPPSEALPVSAPLTLPPSTSFDVMPVSSSRTSPFFNPVAPAPPASARLKEWLVAQWPVVAIGSGALVVGTVALWLLFSGGPGDASYARPLAADAAVAVARADAAAPREAPTPRDAGAGGAPAAPQDAAARAAVDSGPAVRVREGGGPERRVESPGLLSIQARPSATAILDGRKLGETPIYRKRTPAGWHTLELRAPGLPALRRRIQVQPGREFKRTFDLKAAKEK
jgi:eukaryotic-like serine/threonine-protein kinase